MSLILPQYGDALTLLTSQSSGSTSGNVSASTISKSKGPIKLSLINGPVVTDPPASYTKTLFGRLSNCIRVTLPTNTAGTESMSITEAYYACRTLVRSMDMGEDIYRVLTQQLEQYKLSTLKALNTSDEAPVQWLEILATQWQSFENRVKTLQSMLSDIDQVYIASHPKLHNIERLGHETFRYIIDHPAIKEKVQSGVVEWLNQERLNPQQSNSERMDQRKPVITLRKCLVSLHQYGALLESPYLQSTIAYWTDEGAVRRNAENFSAADYIATAINDIKAEEDRAGAVLLPGGWEPISRAMENALLADAARMLASKALQTLLVKHDKSAISGIYQLYRSADVLLDLRVAFKNILQENVRDIVMAGAAATSANGKKSRTSKARSRGKSEDLHPDEKIVPQLVALRGFAKEVIRECFGEASRGQFSGALDDAFSLGVGARDYVPSAMMAQALDREMRRGQRGESEQAWKDRLFDILDLSRYTRDKDVFREIYTRALAKRLLTKSTTDDDMEKTLIAKLKTDYDPEFSAGDVMFRDLQSSAAELEDYQRRIDDSAGDLDRCLTVMVLTHAKWPSFKENNMLESEDSERSRKQRRKSQASAPTTHVDLPPKMAAALHRFEAYYKAKHDRHRVAWFHSLGTVTLTSRFPGGDKEIAVSMYQSLVLLLFNEQDQFSAGEIQARTRLNNEDLEVTMQSLALGKKRLLLRVNPKTTKDIALSDEFKWNSDFTDAKRNIRIQSIQQQTTMEETQEVERDILEGRHYVIDAAIVRIMKAKKTLTYEQIKTETIIALEKHFQPTVADIKKRIDELQEKDYISRDENDRSMFHYVA